ncbi:MAG: zinc ribbon domain-containing protein [Anaerolineales bacterium]
MWVVPLLLIFLLVYAISGNNFVNIFKPVASRACPNCGKPSQSDWKTCPHCGQTL